MRTPRSRWITTMLAVALAVLAGGATAARAAGSGHASAPRAGSSAPRTVHVSGYVTRSGKVVAPYERSAGHRGAASESSPSLSVTARRPLVSPAPGSRGHWVVGPDLMPRWEAAGATSGTAGGPARDARGRIVRSESAKHAFEVATGHPHGWPGHVVDHVRPLACGGADDPSNMQWQTVADAKDKDRWERRACSTRPFRGE